MNVDVDIDIDMNTDTHTLPEDVKWYPFWTDPCLGLSAAHLVKVNKMIYNACHRSIYFSH